MTCQVIQSMLQSKLQESVAVLDPEIEVSNLDVLAEKYANAKVILVILTQGLLQDVLFASALAACPVEVRGNLVPIKADENFIYPDPTFWEKLAAGQIFSAAQLAKYHTDFEGVRAAYARLFNVLALKFTSHGSESIQTTEIQVMNGRLAPMLSAGKVEVDLKKSPTKQASMEVDEADKVEEPVSDDYGYPTKEEIREEAVWVMAPHCIALHMQFATCQNKESAFGPRPGAVRQAGGFLLWSLAKTVTLPFSIPKGMLQYAMILKGPSEAPILVVSAEDVRGRFAAGVFRNTLDVFLFSSIEKKSSGGCTCMSSMQTVLQTKAMCQAPSGLSLVALTNRSYA